MVLAVVDIGKVKDPQPAAFHEKGASKYLGMSRPKFLELVYSGTLPFTTHANGSKRLYLRSDLDTYLDSRPRSRMPARERSLRPALKGIGK
jgi:excisionase family DNA binding protein